MTLARFVIVGVLVVTAGSCRRVSGAGAAVPAAPVHAHTAHRADTPPVPVPGPRSTPIARMAEPPPPAARRQRATAGIVAGTAIRVNGVAAMTPGVRLAGYLIRPGIRRALSAEQLAALVGLVRSGTGFDDSITRRCRPGKSVGFELVRKSPTSGDPPDAPVTELVLDFGCNKLAAADAGEPAEVHTSYFAPSRGAFVAFVKRVLPDDREILQLR